MRGQRNPIELPNWNEQALQITIFRHVFASLSSFRQNMAKSKEKNFQRGIFFEIV